jgi:transposase, IS605 OrfB family, central region
MIRGYKVKLHPNNKQKSKLNQCAGLARFAYNWALQRQQENYKNGGKFIEDGELRKEFTLLKKRQGYEWLNNYSNNIPKQAIKDACIAYDKFFKGLSEFPRFKSKRKSKPSFYVDTDKIQFTATHVKLEKLTLSKRRNRQKFNLVKLAEKSRIPVDIKYNNPRVTFDGLSWWIGIGSEKEDQIVENSKEGIGVDVGVLDLAICSDEVVYKNINKTDKVKKLQKRLKRQQRQVSRKYEMNRSGNKYIKTNNIVKLENKIRKTHQRLTGIRHNYLHQTTSEIINRKPRFVVMENLNVSGMMRNRHLAKAIQEQSLFELKRQMEYKSEWNQVRFIEVGKFYPSSKLCSCCGHKKTDLKLSDRIYNCDNCGIEMDRDLNAAINLKNYGLKTMKEESVTNSMTG